MEIIIPSIIIGVGYLLSKNEQYENKNNDIIDVPNIEKNLAHKHFSSAIKQTDNIISKNHRDIKSNLSGEIIEEFTHNNMTPFFGGNVKQNINPTTNEQILEKHTGESKFKFTKTEQNPFFKLNKESTTGTPNVLENHLERYVPSLKKTNEFPIEKELVGPGLNQGYTNLPSGGFHQESIEYILPKTVDELRTINNPKLTYGGRILSGKHMVTNVGKQSEVNKNNPETAFEMGHERVFTTVSNNHKPTATKNIYMKNTNRQNPTEYTGIGNKPTKNARIAPAHKNSKKTTLLNSGHRNLHAKDQWSTIDSFVGNYGKHSISNPDNERTHTEPNNHILNVTNIVKAIISPIQDMFRTTRKENVIGNLRESGNLKSEYSKGIIYDPNDVARTTIKETNIHNTNNGYIESQSKGIVYDPNDVARTTIKETNIHNNNNGYLESHSHKGIVYNPNDVARTTIKETNIHDNRTANINNIHEKGIIYDDDYQAKTTMKQTTEVNNHNGHILSTKGHTVIDNNQVARTTIKETTVQKTKTSTLSAPTKLYVYNPNNVARTTTKETTIDNRRRGNLGNTEKSKGGYLTNEQCAPDTNRQHSSVEYSGIINNDRNGTDGYLVSNIEMGNTNRQFTTNEYTGSAGNVQNSSMSYADKYNMNLNYNKEQLSKKRSPTVNNVKLVNGKDSINVSHSKNNLNSSRMLNKDNINTIYKGYNGCELTTHKKYVDNETILDRTNPEILNTFNNNPFTQPLTSFA